MHINLNKALVRITNKHGMPPMRAAIATYDRKFPTVQMLLDYGARSTNGTSNPPQDVFLAVNLRYDFLEKIIHCLHANIPL